MKQKTRNRIELILNLVIVIATVLAVGQFFWAEPDELGQNNEACFRYFTVDSNILVAIGSLVTLVWNFRRLKNPELPVPRAVRVLKFVGTVSVTVTFMTVVFFLAPVATVNNATFKAFFWFFKGNTFALHLTTPLCAIASAVYLENDVPLTRPEVALGLAPTVLYSLVYLYAVIITREWSDFYGFTFGGHLFAVPIAIVLMYAFTLLFSMGESAWRNRVAARRASGQ